MSEPQIPGRLVGRPTEGNPAPVIGITQPGYVEGPTPIYPPYGPAGAAVAPAKPIVQRPYAEGTAGWLR